MLVTYMQYEEVWGEVSKGRRRGAKHGVGCRVPRSASERWGRREAGSVLRAPSAAERGHRGCSDNDRRETGAPGSPATACPVLDGLCVAQFFLADPPVRGFQ